MARIVFKLEANESTLFYTVVYYMTALYQLISLFPEECGRNGSDERSFKDLISRNNIYCHILVPVVVESSKLLDFLSDKQIAMKYAKIF